VHASTFIEREFECESVTEGRIRLFSLYVDHAAALRARWATSQIASLVGEHWKTPTEMWNLDSLTASDPIQKMIFQNAMEADVLVVAMSSLNQRELELIQWLNSLTVGKSKSLVSRLFIGLLGDEEHSADELEWTVEQFLRCAQRMNRDFIWRWMEPEAMADGDWLADSMTALLNRKQHACDMTFWQEAAQ
jgi:hypothetical protein